MRTPNGVVRQEAPQALSEQGLAITSFAAVMGFCSNGLVWRAAAGSMHVPAMIGESLLLVGAVLFVILCTIYVVKAVRRFDLVKTEFLSPATGCFFGCVPIAAVLVAAGALPYAPGFARLVWCAGAAAQIALCVFLLGRWIALEASPSQASPAWLIPIVGNVTAAFSGAPLGYHELCFGLLSVGLVCWLAFLPILLNRLIFHPDAMPNKAAPSLAVFVSAPAAAALAWSLIVVDGGLGFRLLLYAALFFAVLVMRLGSLLLKADFSVAWWAYTFPSGALAGCLVRYADMVSSPWTTALAWFGITAASLILLTMFGRDLHSRLCISRGLREIPCES